MDAWDALDKVEAKESYNEGVDAWDSLDTVSEKPSQVEGEKEGGYWAQFKEGGRELVQSLIPDAILLMFKEGNYFDNVNQYVKEETGRVEADIKARTEAPVAADPLANVMSKLQATAGLPANAPSITEVTGTGNVEDPRNWIESIARNALPVAGESALLAPAFGAKALSTAVGSLPVLAASKGTGEVAAQLGGEGYRPVGEIVGGIGATPLSTVTSSLTEKGVEGLKNLPSAIKAGGQTLKHHKTVAPHIDSMIKAAPGGDLSGQIAEWNSRLKSIDPDLKLTPAMLALANPAVKTVLESQGRKDPAFLGQMLDGARKEYDTLVEKIYSNQNIVDKEGAVNDLMAITRDLGRKGTEARLAADPVTKGLREKVEQLSGKQDILEETLSQQANPNLSVLQSFKKITDDKLKLVSKEYNPVLNQMESITPDEVGSIYKVIKEQKLEKTVSSITKSAKEFSGKFEPTKVPASKLLDPTGQPVTPSRLEFESMTAKDLHNYQAYLRREMVAANKRGDEVGYLKTKAVRDTMRSILNSKDPKYAEVSAKYAAEKQRVAKLHLNTVASREGWELRAKSLLKNKQAVDDYISEATSPEDIKPLADAFITSAYESFVASGDAGLKRFLLQHRNTLNYPELAETKALLSKSLDTSMLLKQRNKEVLNAIEERRDLIANDIFSKVYRDKKGLDANVDKIIESQEGLDVFYATVSRQSSTPGSEKTVDALKTAVQSRMIKKALDKGVEADEWLKTDNPSVAYEKILPGSKKTLVDSAETLSAVKRSLNLLEDIQPPSSITGKGSVEEAMGLPPSQVYSVLRDRISSVQQKIFILGSKFGVGKEAKKIDKELKELMSDSKKLEKMINVRQGTLDAKKSLQLDKRIKEQATDFANKYASETSKRFIIYPGVIAANSEEIEDQRQPVEVPGMFSR
jgi:hypothetical protein